ncbi:MAG: hypothetical protein DPW16_07030 [Chloroflexi bacterium]|nr:hypothetical protein [Chloroflexota bacterium]
MSKIKIFVSYSHEDMDQMQDIMGFIKKPVEVAGGEFWIDKNIQWGMDWNAEINLQLQLADIALMMISQSFLNSDYIMQKETPTFLLRRRDEGLIILPVLLKQCLWQDHEWLQSTQIIPNSGRYIKRGNKEAIYSEIASALKSIVKRQSSFIRKTDSIIVRRVFGLLKTENMAETREWKLYGTRVFIGRDPDNHISFEHDTTVSRTHAVIHKDEWGNVTITDQNTKNGTFVDDERLRPGQPVKLKHGSTIIIAKQIVLRFQEVATVVDFGDSTKPLVDIEI